MTKRLLPAWRIFCLAAVSVLVYCLNVNAQSEPTKRDTTKSSSPAVSSEANSDNNGGRKTDQSGKENGARTLLGSLLGNPNGDDETDLRLDPDRPHLPEASTAVGKGKTLMEAGYTFTGSGGSSPSSFTLPEALLRVGVFANWFEVRLGQNFKSQQEEIGITASAIGAQDLYLGVKVALNEQKRYIPEMALIPQFTVPTGSAALTGGRPLPGLNVDYTWDILEHRYGIELVMANNRVADNRNSSHLQEATGITHVVQFNARTELFGEWDAIYAKRATYALHAPQHYAVGGMVFFVNGNLALDFRTGVGLNVAANRFLIGAGIAFRH